uniref:Fas apoptotic inhibitory molecule 1 n=1 Tax=Arion vulgaris TaxID=1028688 RepID=A0A0B6ZCF4_9EUPU
MSDIVATWDVALSDGIHKVEFEHGTTTGKRVIRVGGKEIYRQDWMFKLVGKEIFQVGKATCCIIIDAVNGFAYEYTLSVNGKSLKKFKENQSKIMRAWVLYIAGNDTRVVLEKDTLDVWVNGRKVETTGEFVDDGTETHFEIENHSAYIKGTTTGKRRDGVVHQLFVDDTEIPPAKE